MAVPGEAGFDRNAGEEQGGRLIAWSEGIEAERRGLARGNGEAGEGAHESFAESLEHGFLPHPGLMERPQPIVFGEASEVIGLLGGEHAQEACEFGVGDLGCLEIGAEQPAGSDGDEGETGAGTAAEDDGLRERAIEHGASRGLGAEAEHPGRHAKSVGENETPEDPAGQEPSAVVVEDEPGRAGVFVVVEKSGEPFVSGCIEVREPARDGVRSGAGGHGCGGRHGRRVSWARK